MTRNFFLKMGFILSAALFYMHYAYIFYTLGSGVKSGMEFMWFYLLYQLILMIATYYLHKSPYKEKKPALYMSIAYGWPILLFLVMIVIDLLQFGKILFVATGMYAVYFMILYCVTTLIYVFLIFIRHDEERWQ